MTEPTESEILKQKQPRTLQEWVDAIVVARREGRLSDDELDILIRQFQVIDEP